MLRSMTAFARQETQLAWGKAVWELRSVNHRFLELNLRLPEELRHLENAVRERISQHVKRGKVDCTLRFEAQKGTQLAFALNYDLIEQLLAAARAIRALDSSLAMPTVNDILRWPGVLDTPTADLETLSAALLHELDQALGQFVAHRQREGAQLAAIFQQRCAEIAAETARLRARIPEILNLQRTRLAARLEEIFTQLDKERLEQEALFLAQKMDITEELERLEAHLQEVLNTLQQPQPVGRRLDFLMQELNREANTLGAKSVHADTSQGAVNLKVLIEQMREQVQNVE